MPERIIRKYANRRLYDAAESRHVTLSDIRDFVVRGESIRVIDDRTSQDITRATLLLVITDQKAAAPHALPDHFLTLMIRAYGDGMQDAMRRYLEKSAELFATQHESLRTDPAGPLGGAQHALVDLWRQHLRNWGALQASAAEVWNAALAKAIETGTPSTKGSGDRD
jgi:polyhydroxyalkanoate synthesis repressor PhaR